MTCHSSSSWRPARTSGGENLGRIVEDSHADSLRSSGRLRSPEPMILLVPNAPIGETVQFRPDTLDRSFVARCGSPLFGDPGIGADHRQHGGRPTVGHVPRTRPGAPRREETGSSRGQRPLGATTARTAASWGLLLLKASTPCAHGHELSPELVDLAAQLRVGLMHGWGSTAGISGLSRAWKQSAALPGNVSRWARQWAPDGHRGGQTRTGRTGR
jgi:hypothetical protein